MYNDTPAARKLMQYLYTPQAQQIWVNDGGTLAANKQVTYSDEISKNSFAILANAKNVEVGAGDYMPSDMRNAYWKSILNFTKDQSQLDSILSQLNQVQSAAYST
jgi:alpha-glucoside transport system substrate-binding protein